MSAPNGQRANLLSCPRFAALLCAVRCGERPNSWVVGLASGLQRHQNQHQKLEHHGQSSQFDRADLVLGLESLGCRGWVPGRRRRRSPGRLSVCTQQVLLQGYPSLSLVPCKPLEDAHGDVSRAKRHGLTVGFELNCWVRIWMELENKPSQTKC